MDNEVKGDGNSYDFGARLLDPRIGRWLTIDPQSKKQPSQSTYKAFLNNPLVYIDPNGETEYETVEFYDEKGHFLFKVTKVVSSNLMSGGDLDDEDGANISGGYDYRHVTKITVMNDGSLKLKAKKTTEILKGNGLKDKEYFFFAKKKGVIYNCDNPITIEEGDGGKQNGGFTLVSSEGGASQTKQKALNPAEERNIEDLITYFGAGQQALYDDLPKLYELLPDLADKIKGVLEESGLAEKYKIPVNEKNFGIQSSKNNPMSNKEYMDKPKGTPWIENGSTRYRASESEKEKGDTVGGNPNVQIYPK